MFLRLQGMSVFFSATAPVLLLMLQHGVFARCGLRRFQFVHFPFARVFEAALAPFRRKRTTLLCSSDFLVMLGAGALIENWYKGWCGRRFAGLCFQNDDLSPWRSGCLARHGFADLYRSPAQPVSGDRCRAFLPRAL